jgi:hypothetical protein
MRIIIKNQAQKTLLKIAEFVEDLNTQGSREIWIKQFLIAISKYAKPIQYAPCKYIFWASKGYKCISVKKWIIIFKIENNEFIIYRIIHANNFIE